MYVSILDAILYQSEKLVSQVDLTKKIDDRHEVEADDPNLQDNAYYDEADVTNVDDDDDRTETASIDDGVRDNDTESTSGSFAMREHLHPRGYRRLVKETVREVIQQMLDSGLLMRPGELPAQGSSKKGRHFREYEPTGKGKKPVKALGKSKQAAYYYDSDDGEDPLEEMSHTLRQLWSPLLHVPENKIHDDDSFFYLGGDSILAMELARHAREAGVKLTVANIFRSPVFSDMAEAMVLAIQNRKDDEDDVESIDERQALVETKHPQPFSLLQTANPDAFVQDYICPRVGVFRSGIIDAFPVTDYQALSVAATLLQARWMLNYLAFDGTGPVDLERIRKAASHVVQHFAILRTVFLPSGNGFIQVVLRSLRPQVHVYETDMDLKEYTRQLHEESPNAYPKMGEPFTQFMIIKKAGSQNHRVILRISHAQYDGVCLPSIIEAFRASYENKEMPPVSPPFSNFIQDATAGIPTNGHREYWKSLLHGSSMTRVVDRDQPKYHGTDMPMKVLTQTIKLPALTAKNVTTATILKAAWTLILAQITGRNDIVFGGVISGRNAAVESVESIVAPCINIVPIRVQIEPSWTALDLLRRIQNQQVAGMAFESLGFREIIQQCTDWPGWTYFSTIVQHQNLAEDVSTVTLDRTKYKVQFEGTPDTLSDLTLLSTPKGSDMVQIAIECVDDGVISSAFVQRVLDLTCSLAQNFANNPNRALPTVSELSATNAISSQPEAIHYSVNSSEMAKLDASLRRLNKLELCDLADTLTRAWRIVLPKCHQTPSILNLESSFYDCGGDIISLASLCSFLEGEGYKLKLEDLIARPTVGAQVALLGEQRKRMAIRLGGSESSSETLQGSQSSLEAPKGVLTTGKGDSVERIKLSNKEQKAEKKPFWKVKSGKFARRFGMGRTNQEIA